MGRGGVAVATVMGTVQVKENSQSVQCCSQLSLKQVGPGGVTIYPPLSLSLSLSLLSTIVFKTGGTRGRDDISTIIIIVIIIIIVYNCLQNRWDPGAWRSPPPWRAAVLETEALPSLGLKVLP